MNEGIDIKIVQERYAGMSDRELVFFVTGNGYGLTPEALKVVKEEIAKRGINSRLADVLDIQNRSLSEDEIDDYCALLSHLHCPVCGSNRTKLNATLTAEVTSFIFITEYKTKIRVACPACLDKLNDSALMTTRIFGWWALPWGIIKSRQAISVNNRSKQNNHKSIPSLYLKWFVVCCKGQLELHKHDRTALINIISHALEIGFK
nr:hypothetical protein [uncultured Chitinophaga sp.]